MKPLLVVLFTILIFLSSCSFKTYTAEKASVMITNLQSNSGGSGSVVYTSPSLSKVLTNRHVCEVIKNGGLIHKGGDKVLVQEYVESETHDLCLIIVNKDLHNSIHLAYLPPHPFDEIKVVGHPHLMPTITTKGELSNNSVIEVATGLRECTEEEKSNPITGLFCAMIGKLPILRSYETTALSALIQPGSSGSPVIDEDDNLVAVIFAGAGDLAFGYAVPYEYVHYFLTEESKKLMPNKADLTSLPYTIEKENTSIQKRVEKVCKKAKLSEQKTICNYLLDVVNYNHLIYTK